MLEINSEALSRASKFWAWVLMLAAVVISPIYVFASGWPQPAHVLMLLSAIAIIFLNRQQCKSLILKNLTWVLFLALLTFINLVYAVYYEDASFMGSTIYWIYGCLLLLSIVCVSRDPWVMTWGAWFIFVSMVLVIVTYFLGWGKYTYAPRYQYFFEGPNQLAYYVICLFLVYLAISSGRLVLGLYAIFAMMIFIVITTGARSAYLAVIPVFIFMLWFSRKSPVKFIFILMIPFFCTLITAESHNVASYTINRTSSLTTEVEVNDHTSVQKQLLARGYYRPIENPQYLLFGAGQGRDARFGHVDGHVYEIHSSLMAVLFYYGFLGLFLFLMAVWKLFSVKINLIFLMPIFIYGLFTYGLRSPYFWIALGFLALIPNLLASSKVRMND